MGAGPTIGKEEREYMLSLQKEGYSQDQIAAITGRSRSGVRYAIVPSRRQKEKDRTRPSTRKAKHVDIGYTETESVRLDISIPDRYDGWVYRILDKNNVVLYIGQSKQKNPVLRVLSHSGTPWWPEAAYADYVAVSGNLNHAEFTYIQRYQPKYNVYHS